MRGADRLRNVSCQVQRVDDWDAWADERREARADVGLEEPRLDELGPARAQQGHEPHGREEPRPLARQIQTDDFASVGGQLCGKVCGRMRVTVDVLELS